MRLSCDPKGFPLLSPPGAAFDIHLLPVSKVQFERFLAEPCGFGDAWYETLLTLNQRASYRRFTEADRERLFLTGVLPKEALAFAIWLGPGFDLPTTDEWRMAYRTFDALRLNWAEALRFLSGRGAVPAHDMLEELLRQQPPAATASDVTLMRGGVLEWARQGSHWVGLGAPRHTFYPNLYEPCNDEFRPLNTNDRLPFLGFRLIRRRGNVPRGGWLVTRPRPEEQAR